MSSAARVDRHFRIHRASSALFGEYEPGDVAYVSNTSDNNGVLGFVRPLEDDTVFTFTGIVVSAFSRTPGSCGARVQTPPFIACGRSGNGLLVLEPRTPMSVAQLAHVAAYLNRAHGWRFTWYRQATKDRFEGLSIPKNLSAADFRLSALLPQRSAGRAAPRALQYRPWVLGDLFDLCAGDYHAIADLPVGETPLISCGDEDHGVVAHVDAPRERVRSHCLTIALNGRPLTTKYHPYPFVAKDDVAVAIPRRALPLSALIFIQLMLNRERWRYSYYRKCFIDKLRRSTIRLPAKDGDLDEASIAKLVATSDYWRYLDRRLGRARTGS